MAEKLEALAIEAARKAEASNHSDLAHQNGKYLAYSRATTELRAVLSALDL